MGVTGDIISTRVQDIKPSDSFSLTVIGFFLMKFLFLFCVLGFYEFPNATFSIIACYTKVADERQSFNSDDTQVTIACIETL